MEIRRLNRTDNRFEIGRIYEESWRFAYKGIIPQDYLDNISARHWADRLDREGWSSLVLLENGRPVGTGCVCPSRWTAYPGCGEIVSLYLLPEYIGKGFGRLLLNAAVQELVGQGYRDILLWVLEANHRARTFYEHAGFISGEAYMKDTIGGKDVREVLYRLRAE